MEKNEIVTLEITATATDGAGIGRVDGLAVFVPGAAVGDLVSVRIVKMMKNRAYGRLESVLQPSPNRIDSDCVSYGQCGGCCFRHISYPAELREKYRRVQETMRRIGGVDLAPAPILSGPRSHYRNKAQYPVGRDKDGHIFAGFYAPRSHRIVEASDCRLQPEEFRAAVQIILDWAAETGLPVYEETTGQGLLRHIYLRKGFVSGALMVVLVVQNWNVPQTALLCERLRERFGSALQSVQLNEQPDPTNVVLGANCRTLYGKGTVSDCLCGIWVEISPLSFYQVNHDMAEMLYQQAARYAEPEGKTILDLYCGAGTIGLSLAKQAKTIIGVEVIEAAVNDAKENAKRNGICNAQFICGDAAFAASQLAGEGIAPDVVILDPPRKGCAPEVLEIVAHRFTPERIVYVSCDPATLARDVKLLAAMGYALQAYQPVDLFPATAHVETVALLTMVRN